jgi:hypothetical protein
LAETLYKAYRGERILHIEFHGHNQVYVTFFVGTIQCYDSLGVFEIYLYGIRIYFLKTVYEIDIVQGDIDLVTLILYRYLLNSTAKGRIL